LYQAAHQRSLHKTLSTTTLNHNYRHVWVLVNVLNSAVKRFNSSLWKGVTRGWLNVTVATLLLMLVSGTHCVFRNHTFFLGKVKK
jgi:hypothetical protein